MEKAQDQADIRNHILTLWGYKYFIIGFVLLSVIVSFIACRFIKPVYFAESVVELVGGGQRMFGSDLVSSLLAGFAPLSGPTHNYSVVLRSKTLARRVSKMLNLPERLKPSAKAKPLKLDDTVGILQSGLKISTKDTGTMRIGFKWEKQSLVADAANAYVKALDDYVNLNSAIQARKYREFVDSQLNRTEVELALVERDHKKFLEQYGMIKVDEEMSAKLSRYEDLKFQLTMAEIAMQVVGSKEITIGEGLEDDEKIPAEVISDYVVAQMRSELVRKELELAESLHTMNESNPAVVMLHKQIDEIRQKLFEHISVSTNAQVATLEVEKISLEAKQEALNSWINIFEKELSHAPELVQKYERLTRRVSVLSYVYKMLLQEFESAKIAEKKQSDVLSVIDPAEKPKAPMWPNRKKIVSITAIASLLVSVFLIFLIEYFRNLPPLSRQD
ncbi:MAG: GNVR domain-containing protein [bacterium]